MASSKLSPKAIGNGLRPNGVWKLVVFRFRAFFSPATGTPLRTRGGPQAVRQFLAQVQDVNINSESRLQINNLNENMEILEYLTITLFAIWCVSEIVINLISFRNRSRDLYEGADRFSHFIVWFSTVPAILLAYLVQKHSIFANEFGSFSTRIPLLGYLGCLFIAFGVTIRVMAVATLKKQFTVKVSIVERHEIVETGIYKIIRHPAYLGHLASLLGIGLVLGNWVGLTALVVLPLVGIFYRIHVEESALLRYFGTAYQAYASRTKRLLPGIW